MTIRRYEWFQTEFTRAGVHTQHKAGDFQDVSKGYPDLRRLEIKRAPAWSSHLTHSGLTDVVAIFWDAANERYVLIGTDSSSDLACTYFSSAWSHVGSTYLLHDVRVTLGGLVGRNVCYCGGYLWFIGDDGKVYRGADYTVDSNFTAYDSRSSFYCIAACGEYMYAAQSTGDVWRQKDDDTGWQSFWYPNNSWTPLFLGPLGNDLIYLVEDSDGSIRCYSWPMFRGTNPDAVDEYAGIMAASARYDTGSLFCQHGDAIVFSPGQIDNPDGTRTLDFYAFDGTSLDFLARIDDQTASPAAAYLLSWRGELIYAAPASTSPEVKLLVGDRLVDTAPHSSFGFSGIDPVLASLNGNLICTGKSGANEGIHHAGSASLTDPVYESSWLEMGAPGRQKLLNRLSAHVRGATSNTTITIKYKIDDGGSYTTAATGTGDYHRLAADNLGIHFYRLKIQLTLSDTSSTADVRLVNVAALYSIGEA